MIFKRITISAANPTVRWFYIDSVRNSINTRPNWLPFYGAKYGNFKQEAPILPNQFKENLFLRNYLCQHFTKELYSELEPDLMRFGHRVATDIYQLGLECEFNRPYIRSSNAWVDNDRNELIVCDAWKKQKDISAEEGLISIGYDRKKYDRWSRLYQFTKLYLYSSSSGVFGCPLAMTDGAAKVLSSLNLLQDPYYRTVFDHLTSTDQKTFWTSGQWMTEKGGGSDVASGTETVALPHGRNYKLYGYKWFSSATDANIALTLARISDDEGNVIQGNKGLTLFFVKVKENDGPIDEAINIIKLKDKMGTCQLPTAELFLDGLSARKISEEGRGIPSISQMLQITRLHNAISCASYTQRAFSFARDYSHRREAFGKKIIELPLHIQSLSRIDMICKAMTIFAFECVRILDSIEYGSATDDEILMFRILNPLVKLYNAKMAIPTISEAIECIGGQGIIEGTGIPYLYRDVQIFAIWEGTTSVLSNDVLRAIIKTKGECLKALVRNIQHRLEPICNVNDEQLKQSAQKIWHSTEQLIQLIESQPTTLELGGRDFAFSLSNLFIATLLLENVTTDWLLTRNSQSLIDYHRILTLQFINCQDLTPFITNFNLNEYSPSIRQTYLSALK